MLAKARDTLDVNQANNRGITPLVIACNEGRKEVATLSLSRDDIDVNLVCILHGKEITHITKQKKDSGLGTALCKLSLPDQIPRWDLRRAYPLSSAKCLALLFGFYSLAAHCS